MAQNTYRKPIKVDKFARVSSVALRDGRLSARDKIVYVAICDHQDVTGRCWPSVAKLCELSSLKKTAVHAALDVLESLGYIERIQRHASSNLYRVYSVPMADFVSPADELPSSQDGEQSSPDEHTDGLSGEYFVFDSRSGRLRSTATGSPFDGDKEENRINNIKKIWKEELPQNPLGTEKPDKNKAFSYFVRREGITEATTRDIVAMVKQSDFLQGRNEKYWKASLFWCLKNREKVLQGRYTTYTNRAGDIEITV